MTVQYQLRDQEILNADDARRAVMAFMTEPEAIIIDGAIAGYEHVSHVVEDIDAGDSFQVVVTSGGVLLRLVSDTVAADLPLGGLRGAMDDFGRFVAIPA